MMYDEQKHICAFKKHLESLCLDDYLNQDDSQKQRLELLEKIQETLHDEKWPVIPIGLTQDRVPALYFKAGQPMPNPYVMAFLYCLLINDCYRTTENGKSYFAGHQLAAGIGPVMRALDAESGLLLLCFLVHYGDQKFEWEYEGPLPLLTAIATVAFAARLMQTRQLLNEGAAWLRPEGYDQVTWRMGLVGAIGDVQMLSAVMNSLLQSAFAYDGALAEAVAKRLQALDRNQTS